MTAPTFLERQAELDLDARVIREMLRVADPFTHPRVIVGLLKRGARIDLAQRELERGDPWRASANKIAKDRGAA